MPLNNQLCCFLFYGQRVNRQGYSIFKRYNPRDETFDVDWFLFIFDRLHGSDRSTRCPAYTHYYHAADVPSSTSSQLPTLTAALPTGTAAAENGRFPDLNDQYLTISEENQYLPFNYIMSETGEAGGWDYAV
jgi:hypothetical protein